MDAVKTVVLGRIDLVYLPRLMGELGTRLEETFRRELKFGGTPAS